jgi:hypothetical protein
MVEAKVGIKESSVPSKYFRLRYIGERGLYSMSLKCGSEK